MDNASSNCICDNQIVLDGNYDIYIEKIINEWIESIAKFIHS